MRSIQAACARRSRGPHEVALNADAIHNVVAQAGIELRKRVDAAGRDTRLRPPMVPAHTSPVRLSRASESTADAPVRPRDGRSSTCRSRKAQAVFRARPDAISIDQHAEHVVVRKPVRRREVLPAKHAACPGVAAERMTRWRSRRARCYFHNVLRYSIRSFSSSFVRSLVTPCSVFRVEHGPNFFQRTRGPIVQIGGGVSHIGELRNIDHR